jgi:hypothetical protein
LGTHGLAALIDGRTRTKPHRGHKVNPRRTGACEITGFWPDPKQNLAKMSTERVQILKNIRFLSENHR